MPTQTPYLEFAGPRELSSDNSMRFNRKPLECPIETSNVLAETIGRDYVLAGYVLHLDQADSADSAREVTRVIKHDILSSQQISVHCSSRMSSRSSGGDSFSIPSDNFSDAASDVMSDVGYRAKTKSPVNKKNDKHLIPDFPQHVLNNNAKLNHNGGSTSPKSGGKRVKVQSKETLPLLLPRYFEFHWHSSHFYFADDLFEHDKNPKCPSESPSTNTADVTTYSEDLIYPASIDIKKQLALRFIANSVERNSLLADSNFFQHVCIQTYAGYLDDLSTSIITDLNFRYWRAHGPQRSRDRSGDKAQAASNTHQKSSAPVGRHDPLACPRPRPRHGRKGGSNDGSEGSSNHENRGRNDQHHLIKLGNKGDERRVDCPFYKRQPESFKRCAGVGFKKISHLKQHLKSKHQEDHCKVCLRICRHQSLHNHECSIKSQQSPQEVSFITDEIASRLSQRSDGRKTLGEQWEQIYKTIFPDDEPPFPSPYVHEDVPVILEHFIQFLKKNISESWRTMALNLPSGSLIKPQDLKGAFDEGCQNWLSSSIYTYLSLRRGTIYGIQVPGPINPQAIDDHNTLQLDGYHQSSVTRPLSMQQPSKDTSCNYQGAEPGVLEEESVNLLSDAPTSQPNNLFTSFDTINHQVASNPPEAHELTTTQGIISNQFMGYCPERDSFFRPQCDEDFVASLDETWWAGTRPDGDDSFFPIPHPLEPFPDQPGLDLMNQPTGFHVLDDFSFSGQP